MVLDALEDFRGWRDGTEVLGGERVARHQGPHRARHATRLERALAAAFGPPEERDRIVHSLVNLTLLTSRSNSKVSNSAWESKRTELQKHDVLKANSLLLAAADDSWTDAKNRIRTQEMTEAIVTISPFLKATPARLGMPRHNPSSV